VIVCWFDVKNAYLNIQPTDKIFQVTGLPLETLPQLANLHKCQLNKKCK